MTAEVAVGGPKLAVSTRERMLVAFEIDVANGREDACAEVSSEVDVLMLVLDVAESVAVCTSDTERDVKELSGTLVEYGGDSDEAGSVMRRFSVVMAVLDGTVWLSDIQLVERSRAVTDNVELAVELELDNVKTPESVIASPCPA